MAGKNPSKGGISTSVKKLQARVLNTGLVKFIMRVVSELSQDDGTTMAAGVAYYAFLSLFPLILGMIALLGLFLPSQAVQEQIFSYITQNLPGATDVIQKNISNVIEARGTLGVIGIIGLLWSGSSIVSAVGHAINRAWDVEREMQFYLKKPRDIGLMIGLGILFFISLSASAIFTFVPVSSVPIIGNILVLIALRLLAFLFTYALFLILYKVMPNTKTYWRHIWFGALVTALLFEIGRSLFLFYINNFTNYQLVYGSIGSVIAILVWIYYSAIIVIIGAELTAEYSRMRRGVPKGGHSHATAKP